MPEKVLLIPEHSYIGSAISRIELSSEVAKEVGSGKLSKALDLGETIPYKGALYFVDIPL